MQFYQQCLGGHLTFQRLGDGPCTQALPADMKETILHSTLISENLLITATDIVENAGLVKGNDISLLLFCKDEMEVRKTYNLLSEGGRKTQPLTMNSEGHLMGGLKDKFGINWLLHVQNSGDNL